jgi:hypothetical protein
MDMPSSLIMYPARISRVCAAYPQQAWLTYSVALWCDWTEAEESERRIAAVRGRQNTRAEKVVAGIGEQLGHTGLLLGREPGGRIGRRVDLPLNERVHGVQVPGVNYATCSHVRPAHLSWPRP